MAFPAAPTNDQVYVTADGRSYVYVAATTSWQYRDFSGTQLTNNTTATVAPTITDSAPTYSTGSVWIVNNQDIYINVDATAGAAVWQKVGATVSASAPTSPIAGELFLSTAANQAFIWNGSAWIDITASASTLNNASATTAPTVTDDGTANYDIGSLWTNTTTDEVYFNVDVTTGAAVWLTLGGGFTPLAVDPATPAAGSMWFNTTTNTFKGNDGLTKAFVVI